MQKHHWPWLSWPSEQVDCRDIFGQVTLKQSAGDSYTDFAILHACELEWTMKKSRVSILFSLYMTESAEKIQVEFSSAPAGCRNGIGKNWDRAIAIISLQLRGQNITNTSVNTKALRHSRSLVSYRSLPTFLNWRDFYPTSPRSQGVSECLCRMTQGWQDPTSS